MTEQTFLIIEFLKDWQTISHEEVESAGDIKVFNVIGTIIQLASNDYMQMSDAFHFVSDNLSVEEEIKERIVAIINRAYDNSSVLH